MPEGSEPLPGPSDGDTKEIRLSVNCPGVCVRGLLTPLMPIPRRTEKKSTVGQVPSSRDELRGYGPVLTKLFERRKAVRNSCEMILACKT